MNSVGNLTTLQNYKDWANVTTTSMDNLLSRLIASASGFIVAWLNKPILYSTYTERQNGTGSTRLALRNWPIQAVTSLTISGTSIPKSPDGVQAGYVYDDFMVYLVGGAYTFYKGLQNVTVVYDAGYSQVDSVAIPGTAPYQLAPENLSRPWGCDVSVAYANGTKLTKVVGAPAQGQYYVDLNGNYKFAAADAGAAVAITYGAAPPEVEQACIELVALRFKERDRVGIASKSVANENVTFNQKDMSDSVKTVLQNYRMVLPV